MAIPAGGTPSEVQTGDTVHIRGGMAVDYLTGRFVKEVSSTGLVTHQNADDGRGRKRPDQWDRWWWRGHGHRVHRGPAHSRPSSTTIGDVYISKADQ